MGVRSRLCPREWQIVGPKGGVSQPERKPQLYVTPSSGQTLNGAHGSATVRFIHERRVPVSWWWRAWWRVRGWV